MTRTVCLFACGSILQATVAVAQPAAPSGRNELSVHVSPDFEGAIGDMLSLEAGYGRLLNDHLLAQASVRYQVLEDIAGEDEDYRTTQLRTGVEYRFGDGRVAPYVSIAVGWRSSHFGDLEVSDLIYGPGAGVKWFVADNVALAFDVSYGLSGSKVFINDFRAEDSDLTPSIGFRWYF